MSEHEGRLTVTHDLKCISPYFEAVASRRKTFEVRKNDRDYQVGDHLILRHYVDGKYTGHNCGALVRYLLKGPGFGIEEGYVVMSIEVVS